MYNEPMFIVYTGNRFNQVLIFPSWDAAANWLRSATTHSEAQIAREIRVPHDNGGGYLSVSEP